MKKYFKHLALIAILIAVAIFQLGFYLYGNTCNGINECNNLFPVILFHASTIFVMLSAYLWFKYPKEDEETHELIPEDKRMLKNKVFIAGYINLLLAISAPSSYKPCLIDTCNEGLKTYPEIYSSLFAGILVYLGMTFIIFMIGLLLINYKHYSILYKKKNYIKKDI